MFIYYFYIAKKYVGTMKVIVIIKNVFSYHYL